MKKLSKPRSHARYLLFLVFILVFAGLGTKMIFFSHADSITCTYHATTSTFSSTFSSATGGSTICLAPGNYGNWAGGTKSSMVTITPDTAAGGTAPTPPTPSSGGLNANGTGANGNVIFSGVNFRPASFITMNGITFTDDVWLGMGTTADDHDITFQNSLFHAHLGIAVTRANANIIVNYNMFPGDVADCVNSYEGRIQVDDDTSSDGVLIENNNIGGVPSVQCDGIQSGAKGLQIIGNWFHDYHYQGSAHTDGIQEYGAASNTIRDNFFYDVPDGVVAYDGMSNDDIENNIFVNDCKASCNGASPNQFDLLANIGTTIVKHNTVVGFKDAYGNSGGQIILGTKVPPHDPCSGLTVNDNVATGISNGSGGGNCSYAADYNLLQEGGGTGANNIAGAPIYNGGDCGNLNTDSPGACGDVWSNFLLKSNSPGHLASDEKVQTDLGAYGTGPSTPGGPYGSSGSGGGGAVNGDLNGDGHVNIFDLSIFLSHWQQSGASLPEDFNNDGTVNIFDLSVLLSHYGT
jgi:hypothetical protein